jgi:hypothetical protein
MIGKVKPHEATIPPTKKKEMRMTEIGNWKVQRLTFARIRQIVTWRAEEQAGQPGGEEVKVSRRISDGRLSL